MQSGFASGFDPPTPPDAPGTGDAGILPTTAPTARTREGSACTAPSEGVPQTMSVTKRSKRDRSTRAFQKGYQAGLIGRSQEKCPHQEAAVRNSWIEGWNEGHQDQADGAVAIGGLHKRPI